MVKGLHPVPYPPMYFRYRTLPTILFISEIKGGDCYNDDIRLERLSEIPISISEINIPRQGRNFTKGRYRYLPRYGTYRDLPRDVFYIRFLTYLNFTRMLKFCVSI